MRWLKECMIIFASVLLIQAPLFADSRSATLKVSCTILPILEIVSTPLKANTPELQSQPSGVPLEMKARGFWVDVNSNLKDSYQISADYQKLPNGPVKLYSVTAL